MKEFTTNFSRVLCALMLCAGFALVGCTDDPLGSGENTEQGGNNDGGGSGESASLVSVSQGKVTATTVQFDMTLDLKAMSPYEEAGLIFSSVDDLDISAETATIFQINRESYSKVFTGLMYNTKYYYTTYLKKGTFYLYGDKKEFTTPDVLLELSAGSITATSAQITGTVEGLSESDKSQIEVGMFYSAEEGKVERGEGTKLTMSEIPSDNAVSFSLSQLTFGTTYYYCSYVKQGDGYVYGEVKTFVAGSVSLALSDASSITATTAQITGTVEGLSESDKSQIEVGMFYSSEAGKVENGEGTKLTASEVPSDNAVSFDLEALTFGTKYYYCSYVKQGEGYVYGEVKTFTTLLNPYTYQADLSVSSASDLSSSASANSYIVSKSGTYKFKPVKGNSTTSVGSVSVAETLWETFGTSTEPLMGDLINAITYKDGYIAFQTADTFKEGNAVIAAKDASGNILWSWHIWLTDQPQEQVYYNNAGTMMDRNLGATSATPGDEGALGLLYQWGRKDPFLGSSSISNSTEAKSTITWPSAVSSNSSNGKIAYATANPTTFIKYNNSNKDWYYTGSSSTDNTRWTTSETSKSIYDPCPAGWRVPDGDANGVWLKAKGSSSSFSNSYNSTNEGMNFSGKLGSASTIWYPASGYRIYNDGSLGTVGYYGYYWSASPNSYHAYFLYFDYDGNFLYPLLYGSRAYGFSVRCLQDSK